jgi:iron(III) transport system permease protein
MKKDPYVLIAASLLIGLLLFFVAFPLFKTFELSSIASYVQIFEREWLRRAFLNSMILGVLSATAATAVGFLFAFLACRTSIKGKWLLRFMATLPIISPPFMLSLSVILLFGKNGFVTRFLGLEDFSIYGLPALVLVQTVSLFPLAYLTISGILQSIEGAVEDAALNLGASRWRTFFDVTLPLALPGIVSAWLLSFVTSLADFATPQMLSGKFEVLSTQAYLQFTGTGNQSLGSAFSNLLLIPCVFFFLLQKYILKKKSYVTVTGKPQRLGRDLTNSWARLGLGTLAYSISAFIVILYATVLAGCFTKSWGIDYTLSLENFEYVFNVGWDSIKDTTFMAAIATPIASILGLVAAFLIARKVFWGKRFLDLLAMLPLALPGTAIGIGYVLAFNPEPFRLSGTAWIIIISFVFRNLPVALESAKASLLQIDKSIEEAATNLGASSLRVFTEITLPLIKPAIFTGMAYVFVHCMTAVSAVIFLTSASWNHMTVLILNQTEILRFSAAAVLCLVLIVIVLVAFALLKWILGRNPLQKEIVT